MAMNPPLHPPGIQTMVMNQQVIQPPQMQPMMGTEVPMNLLVPMNVPMQPVQQPMIPPPYLMPNPYGDGKGLPDSSGAVMNAIDGI